MKHPSQEPGQTTYRWYQGDLHTHTVHSDGHHTIDEAKDLAIEEGLSFIALTDHNTCTQNRNLSDGEDFAFIPGMELTTSQGHVNFHGLVTPVKEVKVDTEDQVAEMTREAAEAGAYISINHPFVGDRWRWSFDRMTYHAIELWNGTPLSRNEEVMAWWQDQLAQGHRVYITGGSDVHKHGMKDRWYGKGRTHIYAEDLTSEALVDALKKGHNGVSASGNVSPCIIRIKDAFMGDTVAVGQETLTLSVDMAPDTEVVLRIYGDQGLCKEVTYRGGEWIHDAFSLQAGTLFYRAEVWQTGGGLENPYFTNPIFVERK